MEHPGQTDGEDHTRIFRGMLRKQLTPIADVKVLKGTVYSYKNRRIIVKWVRDVCAAFKHKTTTFNIAVQLTDLFLYHHRATMPVNQCQLVALASIWIASKFEEMDDGVPSLQALTDVCDRAYSKEQIIDMEEQLLGYVEYKVPHTTATNFMHLYLHCLPTIASRPEGFRQLLGGLRAAPSVPARAPGTVDIMLVDRASHYTTMRSLTGVAPETKLGGLAASIAQLLRVAPTTELAMYVVIDAPVRLARPVGSLTYAAAAELAVNCGAPAGAVPLLYVRVSAVPTCVFAERAGWLLLRTPNDELLRVAEAALREALINIEFL